MSTPVWTTTAGKLASIDEQVSYSLQLEANTADSTAITYSVIAGSLPSGMELTSTGLLTGIPAEVSQRTLYTFVVRATAGSNITDRTFTIDILGEDLPVWNTAVGQLNKPVTGIYRADDTTATCDTTATTADTTGNVILLDGSYISYQLDATDTDTKAGQKLVYEVVNGSLPPGVTMTTEGKISGLIELTEDERYGPIGGYGGTETYDDFVFDRTVFTISRSINYDFIVRVTDGVSSVDRNFNIFVYSADFFRVDNGQITIDQTEIDGYPALMSGLPTRKPVFITDADLGTFRHDNALVIKIDVHDFDPLQADLEYELLAGSLPEGVNLDLMSGELYGTLSSQAAIETTYTFQIRAKRVIRTGVQVSTDKEFTMKVIGDIDIGIEFVTPPTVGTIKAGIPSLLYVKAEAENTDRVLTYELTSGILPPGITLSPAGNLIGTIDPSDYTDSTRSYSFTITVSDQYQTLATSKEFTINVDIPYTTIEYASMTGQSTSFIDQNIFYTIAQDPNINSPDYIYRSEDANFGMKLSPEMLLISGLQTQTLTTLQNQMEQNHSPKTLYFGDIKTAIAKENNEIKYEVVYIDMKDPLENNSGTAIASSVTLRDDIAKPVLGPRASTSQTTTDRDVYEITTDGGLSFSTSGSKVRYANQLSADLDFITTLYPNAIANLRSRMKSLGHKEWAYLPLWMRTTQSLSKAPLGFVKAVPICYCKPGTSGLIKKRITDKNLTFKNIHFIIDRYQVSNSKVSTNTFTGDGSTKTFVLGEIVHDEDILIKKQTTASDGSTITEETVYVGDNVTADNNISPDYLRTDTQLRSADFENEVSLSHDTSTVQTTMTFTNAPDSGVKITVDRGTDKYLVFRNKGI